VGDFAAVGVVLTDLARGAEGSFVGELVLDTSADGDWLSLDTLVAGPAEDTFEGVVDAILELLVATDHSELSGHIGAEPVEGVLAVGRLVDNLGVDFLESLSVSLDSDTDVVLAVDLEVDLGLESDLRLLVVFSIDL